MSTRHRISVPALCVAVVAATLSLVTAAPAAAELDGAVQRTDGVDGRYVGLTTNVVPSHVWDIEVIGNTAYVAGKFTEVVESRGSWPREDQRYLAAFDATTGHWIDWWRPELDRPAWALDQTAEGDLVVGGEFSTVNGQSSTGLVALDARTGEIDPGWSAVVERAGSSELPVVRDVYRDGPWLYVIGNFSHVTGGAPNPTRTRFYKAARLDASTGAQDPGWAPVIAGRSGWGIAPSTDGQRVHLGGEFTSVNGRPDTSLLATVDSQSGAHVPGWDGGSNAPFRSFWPLGGIVYDVDVWGDNLFVGGAEHYWEMRDSHDGDSLKYRSATNDTQNVETIGDRVFIGCHCFKRSPDKQVRQVQGANGNDLPDFTEDLRSGDGGWATAQAPDGCLWIGGDFYGTTDLAGDPGPSKWVGRFARMCDEGGPTPHSVPSLQPPGQGEQLIGSGSAWRYLANGTHPQGWTGTAFDDGGWSQGGAELGFGDGDETTVIPEEAGGRRIASAVFRSTFEVDDPGALSHLDLGLNVDDGATVWINGQPVVGENMPTGPIGAGTLALSAVWGAAERDFTDYELPTSPLVVGTNSIAVSVHQNARASADLTFDLRLAAGEGAPQALEGPPDITVADDPGPDPDPNDDPGRTLIAEGSAWRYLDDGSDPGAGWADRRFDDGDWAFGDAELGYGDGDEATVVDEGRVDGDRAITTWFRREFRVRNPNQFDELVISLLRDDGAVVYVNGVEVARDNLPDGPLSADTLASTYAYGAEEQSFHRFVAPSNPLRWGTNVMAVAIHSADPGSLDISFDLRLGGR